MNRKENEQYRTVRFFMHESSWKHCYNGRTTVCEEISTMECPSCHHNGTRVVDSRPAEENRAIRRRRECEKCTFRFTTFEKIEQIPLTVIKKDGSQEEFNDDKLLRGLIRACEKRPVQVDDLKNIVYHIEKELRDQHILEVKASVIGEMVLEQLAQLDEVAFVRFASVYRQYKDIHVFIDELRKLQEQSK